MTTSDILFLTGAGFGLFFAAIALWVQVQGPGRWRDVQWGMPVGLVAFGVGFGALAYLLDSDVAGTTLFEIDAPGAVGVQEFRVAVEHPGVEHELLVSPSIEGFRDAPGPVDLEVGVTSADGTPLLATPLVLQVDCSGRSYFCGWEEWYGSFTPRSAGPHLLRVAVRTAGIDAVHLRVEDPQKSDGVRAPGY